MAECQGDDVHLSNGYATAPNDVWSLGVILVNLAASRNPWRQACLDDDTFRAYLADRDYLLKVLPISRELNGIIKRIFCIDPKRRISLEELRESILHCKYFTRTSQVERAEANTSCKLQNMFPITPLLHQVKLPMIVWQVVSFLQHQVHALLLFLNMIMGVMSLLHQLLAVVVVRIIIIVSLNLLYVHHKDWISGLLHYGKHYNNNNNHLCPFPHRHLHPFLLKFLHRF